MQKISLKPFIITVFIGDRNNMKRLFTTFILIVIISFPITLTTFAQDDKSVTLVVNGEGKTTDDAKQSALRNAIEQAFGTFISSKTDILNDELIKDEIVSVSNGNIQKFEVLSEGKLPDGGYYNTLKATVSVSKLTSFCESRGISVEFKGSLFSFNIKQQKINEENELKAIQDLSFIIKKIMDKSFDYKISASQPKSLGKSDGVKNDSWSIPIEIDVCANKNLFQIPEILKKSLNGLSLSKKEIDDYASLEKPFYTIILATNSDKDGSAYYLRDINSIEALYQIIGTFRITLLNSRISNGLDNYSLEQLIKGIQFKVFNGIVVTDPNDTRSYVYYSAIGFKYINEFVPFLFYDEMADDFRNLAKGELVPGDIFRNINYYYKREPLSFSGVRGIRYEQLKDRYDFLKDLEESYRSAYLIMSFLEIDDRNYNLIKFYFNDLRTIDEINKITEYKIIPGSNDISTEQVNKNNNPTDSDNSLKFNEKEFVENPDQLPIIENPLEFQRSINSQIPEVLKRAGIYEKVEALVFINDQGDVKDVQILKKSSFPACDEIAKNVLVKTKFQPGLLKGVPVKVKMKVPVEFKQ